MTSIPRGVELHSTAMAAPHAADAAMWTAPVLPRSRVQAQRGRRRGDVERGGRAPDAGLAERVEDGGRGDAQGPLLADVGKALVESEEV
ncbi:MAG: hypothetical protein ACLVJ1_04460 [Oscillospiraceae bacterium]